MNRLLSSNLTNCTLFGVCCAATKYTCHMLHSHFFLFYLNWSCLMSSKCPAAPWTKVSKISNWASEFGQFSYKLYIHDVYNARMAETYLATANYVWPAAVAPGHDLIPLQRLHVFAHSRGPHPAIKLWCQVPFTKSKTIFQIEMYCMQGFLEGKYIKVELSMIKIGELLRKLLSLRSCFLILPPGALAPQGIKGAVKRDVSKHWCTLQWCASRGWVIAHENWTSWYVLKFWKQEYKIC